MTDDTVLEKHDAPAGIRGDGDGELLDVTTGHSVLEFPGRVKGAVDTALAYLAAGLCVLPVLKHEKRPDKDICGNWKTYETQRPTEVQVRRWFARCDGIGAVAGAISGNLEGLDFDDPTLYAPWCAMVEKMQPGLVGLLTVDETPRGGKHAYYRCPEIAGNQILAQAPGPATDPGKKREPITLIETRGEGGFLVISPTPASYAPEATPRPWRCVQGSWTTIPVITREERAIMLDAARSFNRYAPDATINAPKQSRAEPAGDRPGDDYNAQADTLVPALLATHGYVRVTDTLWRRPGKDRGWSLSWNHIPGRLFCWSTSTPFPQERAVDGFGVYAILEHGGDVGAAARALGAAGYGKPATRPAGDAPAEPERDPLETDMGNARRLARRHGAELRYTAGAGWLAWDGLRWVRDTTGQAMSWAKDTARAIFADAEAAQRDAAALVRDMQEAEGDEAKQSGVKTKLERAEKRARRLWRWAMQSQGRGRLDAMLGLGQSEPEIAAADDDFDRNPWLLNCQNGVIDLRTGELRPHDPHDLLTKLAPVRYDPAARLEVWDRYLADATQGNSDLAAYLQRAAGYTLTGLTSEEVFFVLLGPPASGKTTFAEALLSALGDYGHKASFSTFLESDRIGGNSPELADLAGARLVVAAEGTDKSKLAMSRIKELTGGDRINACRKYAHPFTFKPAFKLWLGSNKMPRADDLDTAIWRRLRKLPFDYSVPEDRRDPGVKAALIDPTVGGPAIIAWAVAGCLAWQREGLRTPNIVRDATAELRRSMDPLAGWLAECCIIDPNARAGGTRLRKSFEDWQKTHGEHMTISSLEWAERLGALGATSERVRDSGKSVRGWAGIGLLDDDE